jgi:hypothetical protein
VRRRVGRFAVAVGVGAASLTGVLASPAWAPKITLVPVDGLTVEACKDGGWRDFKEPTFKNQGQCVSQARAQEKAAE